MFGFRPKVYAGAGCLPFAQSGINVDMPCTGCSYEKVCKGEQDCDFGSLGDLPIVITTKACATLRKFTMSCEGAAQLLGLWEEGQEWVPFYSGERCAIGEEGLCVLTEPSPKNKLGCCLGQITTLHKCNGKWCPKTCGEEPEVRDYCLKDDNISKEECRQFCPAGTLTGRSSWCDQAYQAYCTSDAGANDPLCTCIRSNIPRPACFDAQCTATGYVTADQLKETDNCGEACFEIVDCVKSGKCNIDQNVFKIKCPGVPLPSPGPSPKPGPSILPLETSASSTLYWVLGAISIIIILIIIVGVIAYIVRERGQTSA